MTAETRVSVEQADEAMPTAADKEIGLNVFRDYLNGKLDDAGGQYEGEECAIHAASRARLAALASSNRSEGEVERVEAAFRAGYRLAGVPDAYRLSEDASWGEWLSRHSGAPSAGVRDAIAHQLTDALTSKSEDRFRTIAFVHRHEIIAALTARPDGEMGREERIEGLPLAEILADADRLAESVDMGWKTDASSIVDTLRRLAKYACSPTTNAGGEREIAQELADLKQTVIAFAGPWAVTYARNSGFPEGHIHPAHYDILAKCGARMDDFTRATLATKVDYAAGFDDETADGLALATKGGAE